MAPHFVYSFFEISAKADVIHGVAVAFNTIRETLLFRDVYNAHFFSEKKIAKHGLEVK